MRPCVLGNGFLYLGWDGEYCLREIFWPMVGLANHVAEDRRNRVVLGYDNRLVELGGPEWETCGRYSKGMCFTWDFRGKSTGLAVSVVDAVDPYQPLWVRRLKASSGPLLICFRHSFALSGNTVGEQGFWDPSAGRLYHFKGPLWVGIQARPAPSGAGCGTPGGGLVRFSAAVAKKRDGGVRLSQDTGCISGSWVDHGFVESALCILWGASQDALVDYFAAFGASREQVDALLDEATELGAEWVLDRTERFWKARAAMFDAIPRQDVRALAEVSLKVLHSHACASGGILASCDTDIMLDYRDHYAYVWHRDAAMCASVLTRLGEWQIPRRYLEFCRDTVTARGFFWQRYRPDATRGSGWHPVTQSGHPLPIQEDETALALISSAEFLDCTGDLQFLSALYPAFIEKAARFILDYTQEDGKLVRPSYDLWEERQGIFAFTQTACAVALALASWEAELLAERDWKHYARGCQMLLAGLLEFLSDGSRGFCRGIRPCGENNEQYCDVDWTEDASLFLIPVLLNKIKRIDRASGIFKYIGEGLLEELFTRAELTWRRAAGALLVRNADGDLRGVARYPGDWYFRPPDAGDAPGNSWIVATAWYLQSGYLLGILSGDCIEKYLTWFLRSALPGGIMPEQIDCVTQTPLSVAPLSWSHAMFLELILLLFESGYWDSGGRTIPVEPSRSRR